MNERDRTSDKLDPPEERGREYSDDGVDLTLIRWMLSLNPTERLQVLEDNVSAILRLRGGRSS